MRTLYSKASKKFETFGLPLVCLVSRRSGCHLSRYPRPSSPLLELPFCRFLGIKSCGGNVQWQRHFCHISRCFPSYLVDGWRTFLDGFVLNERHGISDFEINAIPVPLMSFRLIFSLLESLLMLRNMTAQNSNFYYSIAIFFLHIVQEMQVRLN